MSYIKTLKVAHECILHYERDKGTGRVDPVLKQSLRHEEVWGSEGIAPVILNLVNKPR
jgi:hypothetical protein